MKKIFFFVFIFTSTALSASLASCASPQGTVASQATVTFPPPTSTPKQTELTEFNRQTRFEGNDPRLLVGGGESPGRLVSLPQDVLAFLRNNHEGPIVNGDNFIARVSADGVCSVFTTDHLVDSGAVLSEVNDGRVVFSVDGTATVGRFRFPVPDGVACVASLAQEGSDFAPGTILVRFFRDNGKAGAQILNEEPIRPLANAPNRIELVRLESGFQLVTTGADGQEIETQTVDTKGWVPTQGFIAVQEQVAASGERFTLLFDGTIEDKTADGVTSVPGLILDKNGAWQLSVGGEQVELKPADVSFDDDKGVSIAGYTLDKETNKWGVTVEQLDVSNPEAFRTVEWDYLISPAYLAELEEKERKGLLPKVPDNPSYIKPGYLSFGPDKMPTTMIKNNGFDSLFTISSSSLYSKMEKRPFELVDIAKTKIENVDFYFYVIKWENDPGITNEPGFLGYIAPISDYIDKIGLNELTGNTPETYVTGLYISDTEGKVTTSGCKKVLENTVNEGTSIEPFCEYLAKNQEILIQPEIYRLWSEKGTLINKNVIPISFASLRNTSK